MAISDFITRLFKKSVDKLPDVLEKTRDVAEKAEILDKKSNFWSGLMLGAGGALIGVGTLLTAIGTGHLVAPQALGEVLTYGAVGGTMVTVGTFLFRAGKKAFGASLLDKAADVLKKLVKKKPKAAAPGPEPAPTKTFDAGATSSPQFNNNSLPPEKTGDQPNPGNVKKMSPSAPMAMAA
jgi:predicted CopG family antitoxin